MLADLVADWEPASKMEGILSMNLSLPFKKTSNSSDIQMVNQEVEILYLLMYVFASVIVLPGLFGNGLIVLSVFKLQSLKTPTNFLLVSLAIADLLMIISMISFVLMDRFPIKSMPVEVTMFLFPSIDIMVGSASIWNLAAVSLDRGIAVLRPLRYHSMINTKRVKMIITAIWSYSFALFLLSMLRIKVVSYSFRMSVLFTAMILSFIVPCLLIVVSYTGIILSTVNSIRMTRALEKAISIATSRGAESLNDKASRKRRVRSREVRLAFNIMIILVPFVAGWGFYFGTHWYEILSGDQNRSNIYEFCLLVIPWVNSSLNPVIYILVTKSLRKGCKRMISRRRNPFNKDTSSVFTTTIFSSLTSRRPSWFERSMPVTSTGEKTPKRKKSGDSRRGSQSNRKQSFMVTLVCSEEGDEQAKV